MPRRPQGVVETPYCGGVFGQKTATAALKTLARCSGLASVFALHLRLLPRKTASQTQAQHPLERVMHFALPRAGPKTV
ncbi:hypothetical protein EBQ26_05380 [Allofranklinella schreckenbergeri]|uniref:Uncharacterized protein n=1 Tax=Allofranklinella schreckenbergeri TaxID=1076744 RepID=A0A3M6Q7T3_9BURK|nr:hypothetical protein EBQ26_05380 [Allofranklinella schreckenbergeri]